MKLLRSGSLRFLRRRKEKRDNTALEKSSDDSVSVDTTVVSDGEASRVDHSNSSRLTRKVCFALKRNKVVRPKRARNFDATWYNSDDYDRFQKDTGDVILRLEQMDDSHPHRHLSNGAMLCCLYDRCERASGDCDPCLLEEEVSEGLLQTLVKSGKRRGMERYSVDAISEDKQARHARLTMTVLDIQEHSKNLPQKLRENDIRIASEGISRTSRLYARRIAEI